jgi:predicted PurR-regulated permease PerM
MPWWKLALWVAIVFATLTFLYLVRAILLPFVLAWLVAIVLEPAVRKMRLRGWSKSLSVGVITTIFLIVAGSTVALISTPVVRQLGQVQSQIKNVSDSLVRAEQNENPFLRWNPAVIVQPPGPLEAVDGMLEGVYPMLERVGLPSTRSAIVSEYVDPQGEQIAGAVTGFFNSFVGLIGTMLSQAFMLLLVPLLAVYMLLDMEKLRMSVASWIPPQFRDSA